MAYCETCKCPAGDGDCRECDARSAELIALVYRAKKLTTDIEKLLKKDPTP